MNRSELWRGRLAVVALGVFAACGGDDGTEPVVDPLVAAGVTVSPSSVYLPSLSDTVQLTAIVHDQNGQPIAGATVGWAVDNDSVARVSAAGLITAVGNGSATVTATSGSASGTAVVTVSQQLDRIEVSPSADTLFALADTVRLTAQPLDANGNEVAGAVIAWSSGDTAVAAVDSLGLVTAVGNGMAEITATAGSVSEAAAVTVSQAIVALDVLPSSHTLFSLGDTVRLRAKAVDGNGHPVIALVVAWTSKHDSVAAVDSTGLVTALRTGATDVFASSGEVYDSAGISVAQLAAELLVTPAADTLDTVGDTVRLTALAVDANGHEVEDTDYVWSAPHPAVVTVDGDGLVTARGPGTGQVRVKATRAGGNRVAVAVIVVRQTQGGSDGGPQPGG